MQLQLFLATILLMSAACASTSSGGAESSSDARKARLDKEILACVKGMKPNTPGYEACVLAVIQEDCEDRMPMIDSTAAVQNCMTRTLDLYTRRQD